MITFLIYLTWPLITVACYIITLTPAGYFSRIIYSQKVLLGNPQWTIKKKHFQKFTYFYSCCKLWILLSNWLFGNFDFLKLKLVKLIQRHSCQILTSICAIAICFTHRICSYHHTLTSCAFFSSCLSYVARWIYGCSFDKCFVRIEYTFVWNWKYFLTYFSWISATIYLLNHFASQACRSLLLIIIIPIIKKNTIFSDWLKFQRFWLF